MKNISITLILVLVVGCGKTEDSLETIPTIELNKNELILAKGKTERLVATFTPIDTPNKGHIWSSSAPDVASIDDTGLVTAIDPGESTITVTALNGKKTATCKVTIVDKIVNVTGISLDKTETTLAVGDGIKLEATIKPDTATDKSITWSSSDKQIASVDGLGNITAITKGSATITATTNDGEKTASCKVKVVDKGVEISKPEVSGITSISAYISGTAKPLDVKIKEVGICYSTSPSPTIEDKKITLSGEEISYTLNELSPNTTYYVRIYAIVDDSAKYGDQTIFSTKATTEISAPEISDLSTYTAYIQGTIATFGLQTEETGICYSTSPMPTINDTKVILSSNSIAYTLNELTPETTYYVRIYAKINGEFYYGDQSTFTTWAIIKTHFEPEDVYTNQLMLTSSIPASSGIIKIDICYGISPNPKVTDNVATANKENDGKLHLNLTGLKSGTTYYIRAYSRTGSKVEYLDDEVSVQTIGKDFVIEGKYDRYEIEKITYPVHYDRYRIFLNFTYNIKPVGTYLVEVVDGRGFLKKTTNYAESIYIESGTGSFTFKKEGGQKEYSGISTYIDFTWDSDIRLTNIENNIHYHYIVGSTWHVLK